uniref:Protein TIC 214 n=2 Tax=Dorcoceras hygrometricum TaxID=472368 RepID=G9FCK5_9LAMI|nr:hypothetical chloroplast RF19 [Dorcoceras hygrometricum]AEK53288.1 hypothetical chloroplast RF19 [Dorcoceras hygrometricum]
MIFQSFLLGNLVSLCMKIINSVVVVGLYYGFLNTFSIGPSYLFLLRAQVMEEGTEKKVSATTGFITGQLMMFISIYYAPLHLALGRPHTITVLALPYLLFHFFCNNHKHFFDYGSTTRNSMRNFSVQCVFLNNLIFQLFNHFILPSSMLARLVNIYMFRCNNKTLFVTSSFVGWLIGHILFMKWLGLVLVWIRQNHSIRSNVLIRSNKYLVSELKDSMARIFSIFLFITCVYYLGRIPSPILTKKLKETSKTEERVESEEERNKKIDTQEKYTEEDRDLSFFFETKEDLKKINEMKEIRVNRKEDESSFRLTETGHKRSSLSESSYLKNSNENNENLRFKILNKKTENKDLFVFDKYFLILLFDLQRWNRPFRYIKNDQFTKSIRKEMSQYFFDICQSDGKEKISFTYPPSLSIFLEKIKQKVSPDLYKSWVYINKQRGENLNNEFFNRIEALDKKYISLNIFETRIRLCNDYSPKEYLSKEYDPFLNGSYRRTLHKNLSPSILKKTSIDNFLNQFRINRIHGILLLDTALQEVEEKMNRFAKKPLSTEMIDFLTFISKIDSEKKTKYLNSFYLVNKDTNDQKIRSKSIKIKEIIKKVPRWTYKLITDLEQQSGEHQEDVPVDHQIRSRKGKRVVIFTGNKQDTDPNTNKDTNIPDQTDEVALMRYSQQSDFRRGIIKGSMRAQRRKIVIWKFFQANVQAPLFLNRMQKYLLFSFDISGLIKEILQNWVRKRKVFKNVEYTEEQTKRKEKNEENKRKEKGRIDISEAWDSIPFTQVIRGCMLVTQSIFRKYILFPFLIIAKNIGRIVLLQLPEWSEDLQDWNREMYIKCTYNGVPLSETEFPKNWLTDGIQIKILFPFCLKPWHKSKLQDYQKDLMKKEKDDFCFLTVWGMEAEFPFGSPRKRPSFFKPIFKELEKEIGKLKKKYFRVLIVFKGKTKLLQKASKETKKWIIKNVSFIKKIKKLSKVNPILLFQLREVDESSENQNKQEKDSIISNQILQKSVSKIASTNWSNSSLTEKKMNDLTDRTSRIRNQIERITKEKKKLTTRINNNSPNKISSNAKRLAKWKVLKRGNARLISKFFPFFNFFIERIYTYIFLSIINIPRINTELFLKSTNKIIEKFIYNNERKKERINKKKRNPIPFLSNIKKTLAGIRKRDSHYFSDLSYMSQAYVFYKLSKIQVSNSYKLRSILKYQGIRFFLKPEIKDSFAIQEMFHSKLGDKKLSSSKMNQWKGWLKGYNQYNLSQIRWSRLISEKWRNRVYHCRMTKKENLRKSHLYEKSELIYSKKQQKKEVYPLVNKSNKKDNLQKYYRYDLLSYKFFNYDYENKTECFFSRSPFQRHNKEEISYNTEKDTLFDMLRSIFINNFLGNIDILAMEKTADRKYFDWKIIDFSLIQRVDIETWIANNTNRNQDTQIDTKNSQIINKKDLFYLIIPELNSPNSHKVFFDWMGMNEKMLKHCISNLQLWFFPEFVLLYNAYKTKPWFIPSKLLLFDLNRKKKSSENKKINEKQKRTLLIPSPKNHRNEEQKESIGREYLRSILSQQKDIEENYERSDMKTVKTKQYKSNTEAELDFFLKRYFLFQLRWDDTLNQKMINNIKVYCLLLRLIDPRKIIISSIQKKEMSLDIMLIQKNLTLTELMKKGVLIIEPIRLPGNEDGQFIMYQIIGISLFHKSKHQTNQKYQEQRYVSKNNFYEVSSPHQRITETRHKTHFHLLVPETIFSFRYRRKLRILISFNLKSRNGLGINSVLWNEKNVKNSNQVSADNKHLNREKKKLIKLKLKLFLWPNYRLEDLACMNRCWFDTNNGSHFCMLRIQIYPRLKIRK